MGLGHVLLALSVLFLAIPFIYAAERADADGAAPNTGAVSGARPSAAAREAAGTARKTPTVSDAVGRIAGQSLGKLPGANAAARAAEQKGGCDSVTDRVEKARCLAAAEAARKPAAATVATAAKTACERVTGAEERAKCLARAAEASGVKTGCEQATSAEEKAKCLAQARGITSSTAAKARCDVLANSEERARCLSNAAAAARNCETYDNAEEKAKCLREAAGTRSNYGQALVECKNLTTTEERVRCRLAAASSEKNPKAAVGHVPEECRLKADNSTRSECFAKYEKHLKCAEQDRSEDRNLCLQRELGLNVRAQEAVRNCADSQNKTECAKQVREHVLEIASARLTALQEAARKLSGHGVSQEEIDSFVSAMEIHRAALQNAATVEEKKRVIEAVQEEWAAFKEKALEAVRAARLAAIEGGVAQ